jgi:hypothetical protein
MKKNILNLLLPVSTARATWRLVPVIACCGVLGFLAGCTTEPESHLVSAPPPPTPSTRAVTTTTTTTAPAVAVANPAVVVTNQGYATNAGYVQTTSPVVSTTVITQAPPALQQEVVLAQPSPQHVWLPGYWTWRNNRYEWMAGHWELPPSSSTIWTAPRWEQQGNAYKFTEGYWN